MRNALFALALALAAAAPGSRAQDPAPRHVLVTAPRAVLVSAALSGSARAVLPGTLLPLVGGDPAYFHVRVANARGDSVSARLRRRDGALKWPGRVALDSANVAALAREEALYPGGRGIMLEMAERAQALLVRAAATRYVAATAQVGEGDAPVAYAAAGDTLAVFAVIASRAEAEAWVALEYDGGRLAAAVPADALDLSPRSRALLESQGSSVVDRLARDLDEAAAEIDSLERARDEAFFRSTPDLVVYDAAPFSDYGSEGVEVVFGNHRAGATIKYVWFELRPYNRVGDPIPQRLGGGTVTVRGVGPVEPAAATWRYAWENLWYDAGVTCVRVVGARAEYMDGSTRRWSPATFLANGFADSCSYAAQQRASD